jgi:sec-independent protein translocase protein TatA
MGLGGISLTQLVVILAIVLVVFGTKRVKSLGSDLGGAINGFRRALSADDGQSSGRADYAAPPRLIETEETGRPDAELSDRAGKAKHG